MIAIMTILPRDATAGVGELSGVVGWPRTAFSFYCQSLSGICSDMLRPEIRSRSLRTCIYKENPSRLRIILPLFDRFHESS